MEHPQTSGNKLLVCNSRAATTSSDVIRRELTCAMMHPWPSADHENRACLYYPTLPACRPGQLLCFFAKPRLQIGSAFLSETTSNDRDRTWHPRPPRPPNGSRIRRTMDLHVVANQFGERAGLVGLRGRHSPKPTSDVTESGLPAAAAARCVLPFACSTGVVRTVALVRLASGV